MQRKILLRHFWDLRPEPSADLHSTGRRHRAAETDQRGLLCVIGFIGGMFGGLLGIGGGSVIAPLLLVMGTLRPAQVAGTTLTAVLVISIVGSGAYASLGYLDLTVAWPIAVGSVAGSILGALSARRLSVGLMVGIFLAILPYFVIKEFWPSFAGPVISADIVSLAILGFAAGTFSGLLGISGASLVVPALVGFFLIDHHAAQGIAMSVALADSLAGVATHARSRNIHFRTLVYLAAPALVAALAGALLSHSLSGSILRNLFGTFMAAVWVLMLVRLTKESVLSRMASLYYRLRATKSEVSEMSNNRGVR